MPTAQKLLRRVRKAVRRRGRQLARYARNITSKRSTEAKEQAEMAFWRDRLAEEGALSSDGYRERFTDHVGLTDDDYHDKRVLDVGCGPRGSLEWADMAAERVGLDPLADRYRELGTDRHKMNYVKAGAERIPFPDGHFDIVTVFNALDHVEDVGSSITEITRVTRIGGTCLLLVEFGHTPTKTEPHSFRGDLLKWFVGWDEVWSRRIAMQPGHRIYKSWLAGEPWQDGPGLLVARLERRTRWEVTFDAWIDHGSYKSSTKHYEKVEADTPELAKERAEAQFRARLRPGDEITYAASWAYPVNTLGARQAPGLDLGLMEPDPR